MKVYIYETIMFKLLILAYGPEEAANIIKENFKIEVDFSILEELGHCNLLMINPDSMIKRVS